MEAEQRERGLKLFLWEGSLVALQGQLMAGVGLTAFALYLGANTWQIGVLAGIPQLSQVIQYIVVSFLSRVQKRKELVIWSGLIGTFLWCSCVLVPVLLTRAWQVPGYLALVGIGAAVGAIGSPLYNSWFLNVIPLRIRAQYIATRSIGMGITTMGGAYLAGRILDIAPGYAGFVWVFGLGMVVAVAAKLVLHRVPDATRLETTQAIQTWLEQLREPFRHPNFIRFVTFHVLWVMANGVAGPFFGVYQIKVLKLPFATIGLFNSIATLLTIVTYRYWGNRLDAHANRTVIRFGFYASYPIILAYLFTSPAHYEVLYGVAVMNGILGSGLGLATANLLYSTLPHDNRKTMLLAFYSAIVGLAGFVSPMLGGWVAQILSPYSFAFLGLRIDYFRMLFLLNSLLWVAPLIVLGRIDEERQTSLGRLLADMRPPSLSVMIQSTRYASRNIGIWLSQQWERRTVGHRNHHQ